MNAPGFLGTGGIVVATARDPDGAGHVVVVVLRPPDAPGYDIPFPPGEARALADSLIAAAESAERLDREGRE